MSTADLPDEPVDVVLANELLDNLVFDIALRTDSGWQPRLVVERDGAFELETSDAGEWDDAARTALPSDAPIGASLPVAVGAREWLARARGIGDRVLMFDYAATNEALLERGIEGWLRCFRGHERLASPFDHVGDCDITHDVPLDQLPGPVSIMRQADWLRAHGIAERVETARTTWQERSQIGDLEAMFARSAIHESDALTDLGGLGGFAVMEWIRERG